MNQQQQQQQKNQFSALQKIIKAIWVKFRKAFASSQQTGN